MRVFNAFQIVTLFSAWPFGIWWLSDAPFRGAGVLFWVAIVSYVVAFSFHVACVTKGLKEFDS